ncbi:MAG: toll/interleukin-1 receptor domain-containing protein [Lachnospiraceae bacterium]|nr:toll/interleukin-1 receptor domain-containing protein [Lachnospiraceae bacterium]
MQIFISHSSKDAEYAEKICELLEQNKISCFIAPRDIRSGREYAEELVNGIDTSTAMILLMSEDANHSPHVLREVERAVSRSIPILVYKLEETVLTKSMEYFLMTHQWVTAQGDENYADILRFANDIKNHESPKAPAAAGHSMIQHETEVSGGSASETDHKSPKKTITLALSAFVVLVLALAGAIGIQIHNVRNSIKYTLAAGDTITFGSYNNEPINWRVLKLSEDRNQAVLISSEVLTMKAYDAAEGGKYNWSDSTDYWSQESEADTDMNLQTLVRGNNDWSISNIRTWLNSADEVVIYTDQSPTSTAMAERKNGYQNEAGFLHGFTEEELAAVVETQNITTGNSLSGSDTVTTSDRVYLLSLEELQWFDDAGISKFALPTSVAVEQDESGWYLLDYNDFHIEECCWWLREPVKGTVSKCYLVGNGYTEDLLRTENVGLEGFGIRPALTVDLRKIP